MRGIVWRLDTLNHLLLRERHSRHLCTLNEWLVWRGYPVVQGSD